MQVEKKNGDVTWYVHNNLKFRVKDERIQKKLWIANNYVNVCFVLIMNDFIDRCKENNININIDTSWNKHKGFITESDISELIGEIIYTIEELNIDDINGTDKFSEKEWYIN